VSISPIFYRQLLGQYSSAKNYKSQTVSRAREKLRKTLSYKRAAHKMFVKLTPEANFINVLRAAFTHADPKRAKKTDDLPIFLRLQDLLT